MTPLTHDLRRAIRHRRNEHARALNGRTPARINDLDLLIALGKLSDNQREAWIDTNILGHTSRTISERMGISRQSVCKHEQNATKLLVEILGNTDFISRWADEQDAA